MTTLTVIIATKNEALNIVECIQSVSFANEIIVLDSGSVDGTQELATGQGAKVFELDWPGYGKQQQRGISKSQSEWVLSLDADERISHKLMLEIIESISSGNFDGYRLPRFSSFCGQFIEHSGWQPDYTLRLVKKEKGGFTDHFLHAHMTVSGKITDLKNPIIHYSYKNIDDVLDKLTRYSLGNARDLHEKGVKSSLGKALAHSFWAFLRTYFIRVGFLDGSKGLMLAIYNAQCTYYKYLKLIELNTPSDNSTQI